MNDFDLLQEYVREGSERAFATLVERHIGLIYSASLRQVEDPQLAEEVTQAAFIILARKAHRLRPGTPLSGWLYRTARFAAADARRSEQRRKQREQEVAQMETGSFEDRAWEEVVPVLDEGMNRLGEKDRDALLLRFFENRSLGEVGAALGTSSDSARMRIGRALEKLRQFLTRRGVILSGAALAGLLSAKTVQAVPAGLVAATTALAGVKGAATTTSTLVLVKGTLHLMRWARIKIAATAAVACLVALGGLGLAIRKHGVKGPAAPLKFIGLTTVHPPEPGSQTINIEVRVYDSARPSAGTNLFRLALPREEADK